MKVAIAALISFIFELVSCGSCYAQSPSSSRSMARTTIRFTALRHEDGGLEREIRRFLNGTRNVNSKDEGSVADQVIAHISLPSEPFTIHLNDGAWLISGSLPHAAETKGAIVVDQYGRVRAAALLEYVGESNLNPTYELWVYAKAREANSTYVKDIVRSFGNSRDIKHRFLPIAGTGE